MKGPTNDIHPPQAVLIDDRFDVRQRLEQLRRWKSSWEQEDNLLAQRVRQLDGNDRLLLQKAAQIASLRRRLRLQQVTEPLEISAQSLERIGYPALRLKGHYLAMATLGFNYIVHLIFVQWDAVTGGPSGISGIPSLSAFGWTFNSDLKFHFLVWTFALVALTLCLNLVRSGVGRGLAALAQDEEAAATLGVNVKRAKIAVFVLSGVFASVAGSLYAHYFGYVNPDGFSIFKSLDLVLMVVVGGMGSICGTLFGVSFVTVLPHFLEFAEDWFDIIHGLILVLILMFLPQGFVTGIVDAVRIRLARRRLVGAGRGGIRYAGGGPGT